jgi:hypothetical protein
MKISFSRASKCIILVILTQHGRVSECCKCPLVHVQVAVQYNLDSFEAKLIVVIMEWQIQELSVLCEALQALHFDNTSPLYPEGGGGRIV